MAETLHDDWFESEAAAQMKHFVTARVCMRDIERWGVVTIGTGLVTAHFTNH
jgi:hypothetical protein